MRLSRSRYKYLDNCKIDQDRSCRRIHVLDVRGRRHESGIEFDSQSRQTALGRKSVDRESMVVASNPEKVDVDLVL